MPMIFEKVAANLSMIYMVLLNGAHMCGAIGGLYNSGQGSLFNSGENK